MVINKINLNSPHTYSSLPPRLNFPHDLSTASSLSSAGGWMELQSAHNISSLLLLLPHAVPPLQHGVPLRGQSQICTNLSKVGSSHWLQRLVQSAFFHGLRPLRDGQLKCVLVSLNDPSRRPDPVGSSS